MQAIAPDMNRPVRDGGAGHRAVIDIGSNTVRLVVYGGPARAPTIIHNEKVTAKLGKGVAENGLIGNKAQTAALAALARFRALLALTDVTRVDAVATAASRDAVNGPEFLARAREYFPVRLLSGEDEALTSASGVAWAFPRAKGIVADLGGGSLELTDINEGSCSHGVSLPLGTLRLAAHRAKGVRSFSGKVATMLRRVHWTAEPGATLYLVGGSLRAFARFAMVRDGWPVDDPHGYAMEPDFALRLARAAARTTPEQPLIVPGLSASRASSLPDAAALLVVLITELKPSRLVFSSWGLREGVLFAEPEPGVGSLDPLIAGVLNFVAMRGVSPAMAAMVASWTLAANPPQGTGGEHLRLAATMLCLASSRIEPNLRASQALDWALRKRWIGIGSDGRAVLAAAILANSGKTEMRPDLVRLAGEQALREAQAWGLATRLCRRFSGCAADAVNGSTLTVDGEKLLLSVSASYAALVNEGVERDLKAVAAHLGLKPAIVRGS